MKPDAQLTLDEFVAARHAAIDQFARDWRALNASDPEIYPMTTSALSWMGAQATTEKPLVTSEERRGRARADGDLFDNH